MPSKYARQEWQMAQETNIHYVAITRARAELYYIDSEGFQKPEEQPKAEPTIEEKIKTLPQWAQDYIGRLQQAVIAGDEWVDLKAPPAVHIQLTNTRKEFDDSPSFYRPGTLILEKEGDL